MGTPFFSNQFLFVFVLIGGEWRLNMSIKYYIENIRKEFEDRDLILISNEYTNCFSELFFTCNKHPEVGIQSVSYTKFRNNNQGCKRCGSLKRSEKRRITENQAKLQVNKLGLIYIELIIIDGETNVQFECPKHLNKGIQTITWTHLKEAKYGCKYCVGKGRTTEDFIKIMKDLNPNIEILGEYKGTEENIKCRCGVDNHIWYPIPRGLLYGQGCPICGIESTRFKRTKNITIL